ncbi:MAG: hypothetical protein RLZZ516_1863 [Cyanobacteriota bacterium]|jgi:hypothetical protein
MVMSVNASTGSAASAAGSALSGSSFNGSARVTRRRSSAGPVPPNRPQRARETFPSRGSIRPTYLTLRDHGKVFVADLPRLSDGQLAHVGKEAREVLESISRRLDELDQQLQLSPLEQETRIRAATKRDVTERFIRAVEEEQEQRRSNPALKAAAGESLARAFLEIARHRLPGATFDSLLQEALSACEDGAAADTEPAAAPVEPVRPRLVTLVRRADGPAEPSEPAPERLPVVLTPDPSPAMGGASPAQAL